MKTTVQIGPALRAGWSAFARRPWYLLGLTLATFGLFVATMGNALATALAYIVYCGYLAMFIRHFRDETIVFDDIYTVRDFRFVSLAFLSIIKMVFIVLGLIFFIVPGVYLAVRWIYAELLVVDQGLRPLEALRASSSLTAGCRWKLFGFSLLAGLLVLLGLFAFLIGAVIAGCVVTFALIKLYDDAQQTQLASTDPNDEEEIMIIG